MPTLDIFRESAFDLRSLVAAILKAPYKPGRIGELGLFRETGMPTVTAQIEEKDGQLSLIQTSPRGGANPSTIGSTKRKVRPINAVHLERESTIYADEVQGLRAFGEESVVQTVQALVNERLADLRAMHEVTLERHRASAIQGIVLDADGSPILNLFDTFEVSQQTAQLTIAGANTRSEVVAIQRLIEAELGADPISGYRAFCGDAFFDDLVELSSVKETLKYQEGKVLRDDLRKGFEFGGVTWENYRGSIGGTPFFPSAKAYVYPVTPNLFRTWFAPADFVETVNTMGLPIYAKTVNDADLNRWVKLHSQSNPLTLCVRPREVVEVEFGS